MLSIIIYVNWHHLQIAIFKRRKCAILWLANTKFCTLLLLLLSLVGNRNLSKNNVIAVDHSLRVVDCLDQIIRI